MLLLLVLFASLRFVNPYLTERHHDFEHFVSKLIQQPISVKQIIISNHGFEPVLQLNDVAVFNDAKTKKLLHVRKLQVGVDLINSILTWSIRPGLLVVNGTDFSVYQDHNRKIRVVGFKSGFNSDTHSAFADEILKWFFEQSRIDFSDITLAYHLADKTTLQFTNLNLQLDNGTLQHGLKINGMLKQKSLPVKFNVNLKLRGNILKRNIFSLIGEVIVEDGVFKLSTKGLGGHDYIVPQSGNINLLTKRTKIVSDMVRQPLLFDVLSGGVVWQNNKNGLNVKISKFKCRDRWLSLYGKMQLLFYPDVKMPVVDMHLTFKLLDLAKAKLYYPITELPAKATAWLDRAFVSSKPMTGTMILNGPFAKFPFDNNEGRFLVDATIRDVHLDYNPQWPLVENLNGKMVFSNRSMVITTRNASIVNAPVALIKATIPDLDQPVLNIDSTIRTDSKVGLKFINLSPLKEKFAQRLQDTKINGPMRLVLNMDIPLTDLVSQKDTKINGRIILHENHLQPYALSFGVSDLEGELTFTEDDLTAHEISGELFDRPVQIAVNTLHEKNDDTVTQITLNGSAVVKDIGKNFGVSFDSYVSGEFKYQALLKLYSFAKQNTLELNSDLKEVAINLPAPFAKNVNAQSDFNFKFYFGGKKLSRLAVDYDNQVHAVLAMKKLKTGLWKLFGGEVAFGTKQPDITAINSGVVVSGVLEKLDWAVWRDYFSKTKKKHLGDISALIKQVKLKIDSLHIFDRVFNQVMIDARPKKDGWEIMLAMPVLKGKIFFPDNEKAQIEGFFDKLDLGKDSQGISSLKPQDLLPLRFIVNNLHYGKQILRRVEFVSERKADGVKINKLVIEDPLFKLDANGDWSAVGDKQHTMLRGKLSSSDIGDLLRKFDLTDNLVECKGEVDFVLKWPGAPYDPSLKQIGGDVIIHARNGSIINLSKKTERQLGIGKILNMFSLRHFAMDFRDLTKKGFSFDQLDGSFELAKGNVLVKSLMLDGPVALVKSHGKIGMAAKNYDIILSVTPHITSSVPVIAAIAVNPVIGLVSWLVADKILAPGIHKISTYHYHVTGSWDNPKVQKI